MINKILKDLRDIKTHLFWMVFTLGIIIGLSLAGMLIKLARLLG